jgi:hypothetical protein
MPCAGFHNLRIDVTGKVGGGLARQLQQTVTVHVPDPSELPDPAIVMFGFPGGGAGRGFWCLETDDTTAWSQARYHADRGVVYVSVDHLGAGESTSDNTEDFTMEVTTAGNIATVHEVLVRLADETLIDGFPAVSDPVTIGMGQSMGGYFLIQMQGQQAPFDAVAILGYSCIHTVIPVRPDEDPMPPPGIPRNSSPATLGVWADHGQAQDQKSRDRRLFYMSFFDKQDGWIIEEKFLVPAFSHARRRQARPQPGGGGRGSQPHRVPRVPRLRRAGRNPESVDRAGRVFSVPRHPPRGHSRPRPRSQL